MNKKLLLTIIFLMCAATAQAQTDYDLDLKAVANQAMKSIFQEIVSNKSRYKELSNFDDHSVTKNAYGIDAIEYKYSQDDEKLGKVYYSFGVTVAPTESFPFKTAERFAFNLAFPLLNYKFTGYQITSFKSLQFDIQPILQKYGQQLWDYQQKFMPLKLTLKAAKTEYKVGEPIDFVVTLTNVSDRNLKVKDLSDESLYFVYDNKVWGAWEVNPTNPSDRILKIGETISKPFRAQGLLNPKEFEIYCSYALTFQDVKPAATLKIRVVGPN